MTLFCFICGKIPDSQSQGISLHRFPKKKENEWLHLFSLNIESLKYKIEGARLCSRHFLPDQFYSLGKGEKQRSMLRKNAIPTQVFLNGPALMQRKIHLQKLEESGPHTNLDNIYVIPPSLFIKPKTDYANYAKTCLLCRRQSGLTLSFFSFPKDTERREAWLKACNISHPIPPNARLCSRHFETHQYLNIPVFYGKPLLKKTAIPTIFFSENVSNASPGNVKIEVAKEEVEVEPVEQGDTPMLFTAEMSDEVKIVIVSEKIQASQEEEQGDSRMLFTSEISTEVKMEMVSVKTEYEEEFSQEKVLAEPVEQETSDEVKIEIVSENLKIKAEASQEELLGETVEQGDTHMLLSSETSTEVKKIVSNEELAQTDEQECTTPVRKFRYPGDVGSKDLEARKSKRVVPYLKSVIIKQRRQIYTLKKRLHRSESKLKHLRHAFAVLEEN